jgi:hypothetical protein
MNRRAAQFSRHVVQMAGRAPQIDLPDLHTHSLVDTAQVRSTAIDGRLGTLFC